MLDSLVYHARGGRVFACAEKPTLSTVRQKWWNPLLCTRREAKLRGCDFSKTPGLPMRGRRAAFGLVLVQVQVSDRAFTCAGAVCRRRPCTVRGLWTVRAAFGRRSDVRGPRY